MLVRKTGGWPALIGLVAASSDGRSPIALRALVQDLSGAHGEMYEFLADEILSHLDPPFISFLTKSSILEELSLGACIALTNSDAREIRGWIETGESMSLIRRHEGAQDPRLAPLVRDFMHARLHTLVDEGEVRAMHLGLADHFAGTDWWTSANHYLQAGESERALAVLEGALSSILAEGRYARAEDLLSRVPGSPTIRRIIRSRRLLQVGATTDAVAEAQSAVQAAEAQGPDYVRLALQNTATLALSAQRYRLARDAIERLAGLAPAPDSVDPGLIEGYLQLMKASTTGNLPQMSHTLEALLKVQRTRGQSHYAAITSLNLAQALVWLDRQGEALDLAREASRLLRVSSQGYEGVSASLVSALAHAINGDWPTSELAMREALTMSHPEGRLEAILEAATVAAWFGPLGLARDILALTTRQGLSPEWAPHWRVVDLWLEDEDAAARHLLASLVGPPHQSSEVGAAFRWELARARAALRVGERDAFAAALTEAERIATLQASPVQLRLASLLRAIANGPGAVCSILSNFDRAHYPLVSVFAGELAQMIPDLPNEIGDTLRGAAAASPQRWLEPLRSLVDSSRVKGAALGAEILVEIGSPDDIGRLRAFDRRSRRMGRSTADDLSRRLAPKVTIDDLGLMSLAVQDQVIEGHELRRKVLGLIGFLASRPRGSATPDQVVDVLWPDQDPVSAMNSLHQTIYYLRRVIEPDYRAGKSVEYIHFSTELIRLDPDLVSCRSWLFRRLVASRPTSQRDVEHILDVYSGKFALDFAYEDWAASYRDHLHAAYLAIVQEAVAGTQFGGDLRWRLWVGQRAISVDPDADVIEAEVVRLYRTLGASAAAAEQYAHYSSVLRDQLGVEPPPLEDL
jgi:DNA-binding SARP family transcriptional activator/tetratricopeptide (TPR) repeat protein